MDFQKFGERTPGIRQKGGKIRYVATGDHFFVVQDSFGKGGTLDHGKEQAEGLGREVPIVVQSSRLLEQGQVGERKERIGQPGGAVGPGQKEAGCPSDRITVRGRDIDQNPIHVEGYQPGWFHGQLLCHQTLVVKHYRPH
jgi:hypothetical protein